MSWVGQALCQIDAKVIKDSWKMSCAGYKRTVFHLPTGPWLSILSYLPRKVQLLADTCCTEEEAEWEELYGCVVHYRKLYTAWRTYAFPVKRSRKKKADDVGTSTTSAPCKRRKSDLHVSDGDVTETDAEQDEVMMEEDKENQPPPWFDEVRAARRTERYGVLQAELEQGGSSRVLDKRVTSQLWAAREAPEELDSNGATPSGKEENAEQTPSKLIWRESGTVIVGVLLEGVRYTAAVKREVVAEVRRRTHCKRQRLHLE